MVRPRRPTLPCQAGHLPGEVALVHAHATPWGAVSGAGEVRALTAARRLRVRAPARADPATRAPHPPAGDPRIEEGGVLLEALCEPLCLPDEPAVDRVQVGLVDRPVAVGRHVLGRSRDRTPDVGDERVDVVHRLHLAGARPPEEDPPGAEERLDVVRRVPDGLPDLGDDLVGLAAEVRVGGGEQARHTRPRRGRGRVVGIQPAATACVYARPWTRS